MLNCDERLATDPVGLARRMASLLELDMGPPMAVRALRTGGAARSDNASPGPPTRAL